MLPHIIKYITERSGSSVGSRRHWSNPSNYSETWRLRTVEAAQLISDANTIYEFGCGPENNLKHFISEFQTWKGFDLVSWNSDVDILDLNKNPNLTELSSVNNVDTFAFLGVFEYIRELERVISNLPITLQRVIFSYCAPLSDPEFRFRKSRGWVSNLSHIEIIEKFEAVGLQLLDEISFEKYPEFEQKIFKMVRN